MYNVVVLFLFFFVVGQLHSSNKLTIVLSNFFRMSAILPQVQFIFRSRPGKG